MKKNTRILLSAGIVYLLLLLLLYKTEFAAGNTGFASFWDAVWYSLVTMTTVGYGDITPVTNLGRLLSGFIMLLGYTIIAIPTGIVSASFIDETREPAREGRCPRCDSKVRKSDRYCSHCGEKL